MDFSYDDTMVGGIAGGITHVTACQYGVTNVCCSSCTVGTGDTTFTNLG